MIARRLGEPGFVVLLHELRQLRVLSQREVVEWMRLHGSVLRLGGTPVDRIDEEALAALREQLGDSP